MKNIRIKAFAKCGNLKLSLLCNPDGFSFYGVHISAEDGQELFVHPRDILFLAEVLIAAKEKGREFYEAHRTDAGFN